MRKRMQHQQTTAPLSLFYSYAREDESLREQLEKHLETASVILLLVSSDFLASDYCYDFEMQRALERHARDEAKVIPIILRPCEWHKAPFAALQALPRDGKPVTAWSNIDSAFLDIAQGIRRAI